MKENNEVRNLKDKIYSKDFILVVLGQIISVFGNQIIRYALPLYLLNQTGSSKLFGTVSAVSFIPMLILYPIGGILADRLNKRNIMVILDFFTAGLILTFSIFLSRVNLVYLMGSTLFLLYAIQGIYQPAVKASIPALVDKEYMVRANSLVDVVDSVASVAGPVLGGILYSIFGLLPVLYISSICFIISAIMEIYIKIPYEKKALSGGLITTGLNDLRESFKFITKTEALLWKISAIYAAISLFLSSLVLIASPVIITSRLGFSQMYGNRLYGYAQGVLACGAVVGGVLAGLLSKRTRPKKSPFILILASVMVVVIGISFDLLDDVMMIYMVMAIGFAILLALLSLFQIQLMSYVQILTPRDLIGKVIASIICICRFTSPIGQFVYGLAFEHIKVNIASIFYITGFMAMVISIFAIKIFKELDERLAKFK